MAGDESVNRQGVTAANDCLSAGKQTGDGRPVARYHPGSYLVLHKRKGYCARLLCIDVTKVSPFKEA